jgi:diacylglycerol kinase family enzyme
METIGTGKKIAALLNARAKKVTPGVVRALRRALPDAMILVSEDIEQARRHVARIAAEQPDVVLAGGGDGSLLRVVNLLREGYGRHLPALGILKLGTGNGWARAVGAPDFARALELLPGLPRPLPTRIFDLVEVEGTLCHFAGVGWDARIINDYLRNLDKRSSQLIGSGLSTRLHKGLGGYLYSIARFTIPEELLLHQRYGQPRIILTTPMGEVHTLDSQGNPIPLSGPKEGQRVLYEGPLGVAGAATAPEWGFGFRAFPFAQAMPGFINVRVYDRPVLETVRNMRKLWRGDFPLPGMHDFFLRRVSMRFSRPMPFQIGGDGLGLRDAVEMRVADERVPVVDWAVAIPPPPTLRP